MRKNNYIFLFVLSFILPSFYGFSQSKEIISDTNEFDYLIGMEYSDLSELNGLDFKTRVNLKDNVETATTHFVKGRKQIITSESVRIDYKLNKKVHKILDIIVLNGDYSSCEGCLLSNIQDITVLSCHQTGKNNKESILLALEKDNNTGKLKLGDTSNYKWNPKSDFLLKN